MELSSDNNSVQICVQVPGNPRSYIPGTPSTYRFWSTSTPSTGVGKYTRNHKYKDSGTTTVPANGVDRTERPFCSVQSMPWPFTTLFPWHQAPNYDKNNGATPSIYWKGTWFVLCVCSCVFYVFIRHSGFSRCSFSQVLKRFYYLLITRSTMPHRSQVQSLLTWLLVIFCSYSALLEDLSRLLIALLCWRLRPRLTSGTCSAIAAPSWCFKPTGRDLLGSFIAGKLLLSALEKVGSTRQEHHSFNVGFWRVLRQIQSWQPLYVQMFCLIH